MEKGNLRVRLIRMRSSSTPQLTIKIRFLAGIDTPSFEVHHDGRLTMQNSEV
jgi:hypothetical protein